MSMTIAQKLAAMSPEERARLSQDAWSGNAKQSRSAPIHHIGSHRVPRDGRRPADNFSRKQGPPVQSFQQRPKHCGHCARVGENPHGHIASECPVLANTRCQCCGEKGHLRSRCPQNEAHHQYVVPSGAMRPTYAVEAPDTLSEFVVPSKNHKNQKKHIIKEKKVVVTETGSRYHSTSIFDSLEECDTLKPKVENVPKVVQAPKANWVIKKEQPIIQNNSDYTDDTGDDLEWGNDVKLDFTEDCDDNEGFTQPCSFEWWDSD